MGATPKNKVISQIGGGKLRDLGSTIDYVGLSGYVLLSLVCFFICFSKRYGLTLLFIPQAHMNEIKATARVNLKICRFNNRHGTKTPGQRTQRKEIVKRAAKMCFGRLDTSCIKMNLGSYHHI